MLTPVEAFKLGWAAGFYEGEGNINFRGKARPALAIAIGQTSREPLEMFRDFIGAGTINGPYKRKNPKHKDYYTYTLSGLWLAYRALQKMWDGLSDRRKNQARQEFMKAFKARIGVTHGKKPRIMQ